MTSVQETQVVSIWESCCNTLKSQIKNEGDYQALISPLQLRCLEDGVCLYAPNQFILDRVKEGYLGDIKNLIEERMPPSHRHLIFAVGGVGPIAEVPKEEEATQPLTFSQKRLMSSTLEEHLNFEAFVVGPSNQFAAAAARQVSQNPGKVYNPLVIYGGVGLGKTHLLHAVGHVILSKKKKARVLYLHAERFVSDMVRALQNNRMNDFKQFYRSLDALLIDDIQFFAGKERTQEEFFHTFNELFNRGQIILTCDRYPKDMSGVQERLKSRFGWGLTVAVEPPDLETRVAILKSKANQLSCALSDEVAFFIGKHLRSNVRELEGALKRVSATAQFMGKNISLELAREALKDLLASQDRLMTIENIQRTVADYYKLRMADMMSKRRTAAVARPRQMAMALCKELTNRSFDDIGAAFNGRDHSTVHHACRTIQSRRASDTDLARDYQNLMRILNTWEH